MNDTQVIAKETPMSDPDQNCDLMKEAELANGRWAMIGVVAALGTYAFTGQILPGVFWVMSEVQLALLFPYIPFLIVLVFYALLETEDDDNEPPDKGIMQPSYAPSS